MWSKKHENTELVQLLTNKTTHYFEAAMLNPFHDMTYNMRHHDKTSMKGTTGPGRECVQQL